jgi:hypothetical protein
MADQLDTIADKLREQHGQVVSYTPNRLIVSVQCTTLLTLPWLSGPHFLR